MKVVRLSALRTGRLYLQEIFLVLISNKTISWSWVYFPVVKQRSFKLNILLRKCASVTLLSCFPLT